MRCTVWASFACKKYIKGLGFGERPKTQVCMALSTNCRLIWFKSESGIVSSSILVLFQMCPRFCFERVVLLHKHPCEVLLPRQCVILQACIICNSLNWNQSVNKCIISIGKQPLKMELFMYKEKNSCFLFHPTCSVALSCARKQQSVTYSFAAELGSCAQEVTHLL